VAQTQPKKIISELGAAVHTKLETRTAKHQKPNTR